MADVSDELERALELASLIESASDAVIGVSPAGLITSWSEGAARLFGHSRAEIVGRSVLALSSADQVAEAGTLLQGIQAGERVARVEAKRTAKDGRLLTVQVSASPIWSRDGEFVGIVGIYRDLSEQRQAEEELRASERRYHSVVDALSEGVITQNPDGRVLTANKSAERILGLTREQLIGASSHGPLVPVIHEDGSPFLGHEHPTMVSIRTGEPQHEVVMGVARLDGSMCWISMNTSPLTRPGEEKPHAAVSSFSDITELRQTLEELQAVRLESLRCLALVGEYRDDDTNQHTERVARTAELLARELGLDDELILIMHSAAALHDVGKIGIPDSILLKPGKLTDEEFEVIKTHPEIGGRILGESHFPILQMATEIALTHHEHWDGTGYPSRLRGQEIPITGRITAVADAFDAMTHARPYKPAFSVPHAVGEIERCSGTQFDPQVVDAFMTLDHSELVDVPATARIPNPLC